MRILSLLLKSVVFLLFLGLAAKNDGVVTVQSYLGVVWLLPLVLVMLVMFLGGLLCAVLVFAGQLLSQNREIARLKSAEVSRVVTTGRPDTGASAD